MFSELRDSDSRRSDLRICRSEPSSMENPPLELWQTCRGDGWAAPDLGQHPLHHTPLTDLTLTERYLRFRASRVRKW